jgi:GTP-binding protein
MVEDEPGGDAADPAQIEAARVLFSKAGFVAGAPSIDTLPVPMLPEIAFVGRSNVGKSSLINALTGRRGLALVSNTPGRTREINFFRLDNHLMLVDLPGYGYAKASKSLAAEWQALIFAYLRGRANLKRVILLIDARRGVGEMDQAAMKLLDSAAVSYLLTLTKLDKLRPAEQEAKAAEVLLESRKHPAAYPEIAATSAEKSIGLDNLRLHLAALAVQ